MYRPSLLALAAFIAAPASALTIDFETAGAGLLATMNPPYVPAEGVTFAGWAYAAIDADSPFGFPGSGDFGRAPSPIGAMTLLRPAGSEEGAVINVASGFVGSVTFAFSTVHSSNASVQVYSQSNGHGRLLGATLPNELPALGSDLPPFQGAWGDQESGDFNRWATFTLSFDGVGRSIVFNGDSLPPVNGRSNVAVFFDDVTLQPVPEPSTYLLMFCGLGALAVYARRKTA